MDIILASKSPRRRELLRQIGITNFKIMASGADERMDGDPPPAALVEELSRRKARAVRESAGADALIIAADTVVALDGRILGKPADEDAAFAMLSALSGRRHTVYTGLTVLRGVREETRHEQTLVAFRPLAPDEIRAYIATGEPMDKAGAYGIQGLGSLLVSRLEGDYFNVMGLPLFLLGGMLAEFGVTLLGDAR